MTHRGEYAGCDFLDVDEQACYVSEHPPPATRPWDFWCQFVVLVVVYCTNFAFMRLDDFYELERTPNDKLVDAATTLFPPFTANTSSSTLPGAVFVEGRPDIRSFGFDLGGSTCACTLQWNQHQYWQRLLYGSKYVCGHIFMAFLGVLICNRWQWVLLYKFLNEILEELDMPINGVWARKDPIMNMESRYDSLVNDTLLAAVPFTALCCHLLYVIDMPDPLDNRLNYDRRSCKTLLLVFAQYYVLNEANGVWAKFGAHYFRVLGIGVDTGKVCSALVQLIILRIIWAMRAFPQSTFWKSAACLCIMWCPFIFYSREEGVHEQIAAMLSFSVAGFVICGYHIAFTRKNRYILLAMVALYTAAFTVYSFLTFGKDAFIAAPTSTFYYRRNWCGLGGEGDQNSCKAVRSH